MVVVGDAGRSRTTKRAKQVTTPKKDDHMTEDYGPFACASSCVGTCRRDSAANLSGQHRDIT